MVVAMIVVVRVIMPIVMRMVMRMICLAAGRMQVIEVNVQLGTRFDEFRHPIVGQLGTICIE